MRSTNLRPIGSFISSHNPSKVILQGLWKLKITWDESVPCQLHTTWLDYRSNLPKLNTIKFPRHVICPNSSSIQLHGFCDASERAYGAVVYVRSVDAQENCFVNILCAKTRVAPLKQVTIPRLELCGALLLAQLIAKVKESIKIDFDSTHYWCDSQIVICWLKTSPHLLKTFVANRVSQVQSISDPHSWNYVNTRCNPADLLSRGVSPSDLLNSRLWFHGPEWLSDPPSEWPQFLHTTPKIHISDVPERKESVTVLISTENYLSSVISKFSSFSKMRRVFAYIIRFKLKTQRLNEKQLSGSLTPEELDSALIYIVKIVQMSSFSNDYWSLFQTGRVDSKSSLLSLCPFIDSDGLIRVGGRLHNSDYLYDKKHPYILPKNHHLSVTIARTEHQRLKHVGPQGLLASIRERFWPIGGKSLVRKIVRECIPCFRFSLRQEKYLMGSLPRARVTPARPFLSVGVDFAGPFLTKTHKGRNSKTVKAYVALFVCLAVKAIHLEVVSDLTTDCFIAAFRRFTSRRGFCSYIVSDNGTTFVGASKELKQFLLKQECEISERLATDGIKWTFIPPRSPHFGGLWEAAIKTVKHHLKRTIGETRLTFEEFYTVLTQIEACVNSRPLYPLSDDPSDPSPLTPAHFIIGETLTATPDKNWLESPESHLSRFQRLQKIAQHFWDRWSKEYVSHLQHRTKWKENFSQKLQVGTLVLVKEDGLPPLKWRIGRIIKLHPGADNIVRAVTLKTCTGEYKRPVVKLCALPIPDSDSC
ncbi:unnamed protein product [Callosobruchus maculatus]|uniref:Integrase catalytic domain-containing protein n=1 Tax=Callosobruchus maculatus TaxID=64391 RepID=A0A653DGN3_CALMS|nr:unnamed protein product [Callosobruchus maculatus]